MSRYILTAICAISISLLQGCKVETALYDTAKIYSGVMEGEQEVPSITTSAHGRITLDIRTDANKMYYELIAGQIENLIDAHLHLGKAGENGPVIVDIYPGFKKPGQFNGTLSEGTFQADALTGPMKCKTIPDLVTEIRRGNVYANIQTDAHPAGEIRGQVR
ncbi:MAG: hypothetical protein A2Y07_08665 [Planctomycetes bacterium GWF2_50_10]|nr:MAG: hypothetical protein A2Y07_08665 [Planctomycetes bacterium GWF2_50_10]